MMRSSHPWKRQSLEIERSIFEPTPLFSLTTDEDSFDKINVEGFMVAVKIKL